MNIRYPEKKHGVIFRPEYDLFGYQGWPTVARNEHGTLYAVWSGFRIQHVCPFGKTAMSLSNDNGQTWSCPMIVNDTLMDDRDAGIVPLGNGKMLLSWFTHYNTTYLNQYYRYILKDAPEREKPFLQAALDYYRTLTPEEGKGDSYVRLSDNGGVTWSGKISVPVSTPHGPVRLSDGTILYFGKVLEYAERGGSHWPIAACASADGGKTWTLRGEVPVPEGMSFHHFFEPSVLELPDGRLLGAIRVQGDDVEPPFTIFTTVSDDGGRSWSVPQPTGILGSPPHLLRHSSGAVLCVYGRRHDPFGERAAVSYDDGKTWTDEYVLCDDLPNGDLGYPSSVELDDGSILTVYYQRCPGDRKTSICYTRWKL